jgi:hypothetical protein
MLCRNIPTGETCCTGIILTGCPFCTEIYPYRRFFVTKVWDECAVLREGDAELSERFDGAMLDVVTGVIAHHENPSKQAVREKPFKKQNKEVIYSIVP